MEVNISLPYAVGQKTWQEWAVKIWEERTASRKHYRFLLPNLAGTAANFSGPPENSESLGNEHSIETVWALLAHIRRYI